MTSTTDFIAELVRAANTIERVSLTEKRGILEHAIRSVREMRDVLGIPSSGTSADQLLDLAITAALIDRRSDSQVRAALLSAAGMLRDLRIVMDSKVEVLIGGAYSEDRE